MLIQVQESPNVKCVDVTVDNPAGILADFDKKTIVVELQHNTVIDITVEHDDICEIEHLDVIDCDFISIDASTFGKSVIISDVVNFQM